MDTAPGQESDTGTPFAPVKELDPNSPEFFDACQALVKKPTRRRLAAHIHERERTDVPPAPAPQVASEPPPAQPSPAPAPQVAFEPPPAQPSPAAAAEVDGAALREARRREDQVRARMQALEAELSSVKARYNESLQSLELASQRAGQARIEFGNALAAISERDTAINQMRQVIADQDREITELQRRLIEAEEARIADASAILESLDKYRS